MRKIWGCIAAFLLILTLSCSSTTPWAKYLLYQPVESSENTQLQLRELQQRIYDTSEREKVLKAVLNLLQDDQYMIKNLDTNLGYFNAIKEKTRNITDKGFKIPLKDIYEATVNVSEYGDRTKVRVSFYYKCMQMPFHTFGPSIPESEIGSTDIYDPQFYQEFFLKLDKALFIEGQKL
jgi:hypothetical protein